jgi:hypothetical protein
MLAHALTPRGCIHTILRASRRVYQGAASGIGRLMALEFAGLGPKKLVLLDVNAQGVADVAKEVADVATDGCTVHTYTANLASRPQTQATMQTVLKEVGPVTILINNAGVVTGKKFLECDDEKIELTMKVNAEAHFWTTKVGMQCPHGMAVDSWIHKARVMHRCLSHVHVVVLGHAGCSPDNVRSQSWAHCDHRVVGRAVWCSWPRRLLRIQARGSWVRRVYTHGGAQAWQVWS